MGWNVGIYSQNKAGASPVTAASPLGEELFGWHSTAFWFTGRDGLLELVKSDKATFVCGEPIHWRFIATAQNLALWALGELSRAVHPECAEWKGKTEADFIAAAKCRPDEWLIVDAWDMN